MSPESTLADILDLDTSSLQRMAKERGNLTRAVRQEDVSLMESYCHVIEVHEPSMTSPPDGRILNDTPTLPCDRLYLANPLGEGETLLLMITYFYAIRGISQFGYNRQIVEGDRNPLIWAIFC
jgi:hypothetical protein